MWQCLIWHIAVASIYHIHNSKRAKNGSHQSCAVTNFILHLDFMSENVICSQQIVNCILYFHVFLFRTGTHEISLLFFQHFICHLPVCRMHKFVLCQVETQKNSSHFKMCFFFPTQTTAQLHNCIFSNLNAKLNALKFQFKR